MEIHVDETSCPNGKNFFDSLESGDMFVWKLYKEDPWELHIFTAPRATDYECLEFSRRGKCLVTSFSGTVGYYRKVEVTDIHVKLI